MHNLVQPPAAAAPPMAARKKTSVADAPVVVTEVAESIPPQTATPKKTACNLALLDTQQVNALFCFFLQF